VRPGVVVVLTWGAGVPGGPRRAEFMRWAGAALGEGAARSRARRSGIRRVGIRRVTMSVRVVGMARSRTLNACYRNRDRATNVLSFGGAGRMPDGSIDLGELVICAPVVAREASSQGKAATAHWAHLTVHGVLHLLGFDHERRGEALDMETREIQILDRLGFSNPYVWPDA
jgi:probable rRNA maturation factor